MELSFTYRENLKEYCVEENGYCYYMPYAYIQRLNEHFKHVDTAAQEPVEQWYCNLKDMERRVITKKPKSEEKLSSLW